MVQSAPADSSRTTAPTVGKGTICPGKATAALGTAPTATTNTAMTNYRNLRALDGSEEGPVAYVNPTATGLERYRGSNIGYVKNIGDKLCVQLP